MENIGFEMDKNGLYGLNEIVGMGYKFEVEE